MKAGGLRSLLVAAAALIAAALWGCSGSGTGVTTGLPAPSIFNVTASGDIRYRDLQYGSSGFTGLVSYKPVRHAEVEVVDSRTGLVIATGSTSSAGSYAITFDAPFDRVYVRVLASASVAGGVEVYNNPFPGEGRLLYSIALPETTIADDAGLAGNLDITDSMPAEAFNILDVLTAAHEFALSIPGGSSPPLLRAFWQENRTNGTYYCNVSCLSGEGIYILGKATDAWGAVTDTDGYDDDVIWHEYGHFLAYKFSRDDSPGGSHSFTKNDLDMRLSWSEGWGGYVQGSLKRWLSGNPQLAGVLSAAPALSPEEYVDTGNDSAPPALLYMDYSNPGGYPYVYASNEVAVAKVLLDLEQYFGIVGVWNIIRSLDSYLLPGEEVTLEAFWDGWVDTLVTTPVTNSILMDREVYYMEDALEPDGLPDSLRLLAVNDTAGETHYLYSKSSLWDTDYIAFNATAPGDYTVETFCMRNGADTYLEVLGTDGVSLVNTPSDDVFVVSACTPDSFSQYSSRVIASIVSPGVYYAMVNTSTSAKTIAPPNYPYPGRYGTYSIRVTGP